MGKEGKKEGYVNHVNGRFCKGNTASKGHGRIAIKDGGKPNQTGEAKRAIENNAVAIINSMIASALAGDTTAAKILLDKVLPSLKSIETLNIDVDKLPRNIIQLADVVDAEVVDEDKE